MSRVGEAERSRGVLFVGHDAEVGARARNESTESERQYAQSSDLDKIRIRPIQNCTTDHHRVRAGQCTQHGLVVIGPTFNHPKKFDALIQNLPSRSLVEKLEKLGGIGRSCPKSFQRIRISFVCVSYSSKSYHKDWFF